MCRYSHNLQDDVAQNMFESESILHAQVPFMHRTRQAHAQTVKKNTRHTPTPCAISRETCIGTSKRAKRGSICYGKSWCQHAGSRYTTQHQLCALCVHSFLAVNMQYECTSVGRHSHNKLWVTRMNRRTTSHKTCSKVKAYFTHKSRSCTEHDKHMRKLSRKREHTPTPHETRASAPAKEQLQARRREARGRSSSQLTQP